MDEVSPQEKSRYISQIVAAQFRCKVGGLSYFVRTPSRIQSCYAEDIYQDRYMEACYLGAYSDESLDNFLSAAGIWTKKDELQLEQIESNIEDQKVGLYNFLARSKERETIRKALVVAKNEQLRLIALKHSYDHVSASGIALRAKMRFLLGCSIYFGDGSPYWADEYDGWQSPDNLLDDISIYINRCRITDTQMRELARTDPWRSTWNIHKYCGGGVFGMPAVDLSIEQRSLLAWSALYDSVHENPDCPSEDVIEDDDIFDGWMIKKRRESDKYRAQKFGDEQITNEKIRNSNEVFVFAQTKDDVKRILSANSDESRMILNQRMDKIIKEGKVEEGNMPDSILTKQQQMMERFSSHAKGGK
jgi:hypothetical protein